MEADLKDFKEGKGKWAGVEKRTFEGLSSYGRKFAHQQAATMGLFTESTGKAHKRCLHVYRVRPAHLVAHVPRPYVPRREWEGVGDCAGCGCELWGCDNEREDEDAEDMRCFRCGGDTVSKWELIGMSDFDTHGNLKQGRGGGVRPGVATSAAGTAQRAASAAGPVAAAVAGGGAAGASAAGP